MDTPTTLYLGIADAIARSVRAGTLVRGERLPSVRETARRNGVSIATAVQAYRVLEHFYRLPPGLIVGPGAFSSRRPKQSPLRNRRGWSG